MFYEQMGAGRTISFFLSLWKQTLTVTLAKGLVNHNNQNFRFYQPLK